jgi:FKBP-type peptidyl-prolyl cis-trans isomerase
LRIAATLAIILSHSLPSIAGDPVKTPSGLTYEIVTPGSGPKAQPGQYAKIYETMKLADGTVLYTNAGSGKPIKFLIGGNQAIDGLDEGVRGMQAGEHRKLIVPPSLSKRKDYPPNVPPDATLYYDVELVEIVEAKPPL